MQSIKDALINRILNSRAGLADGNFRHKKSAEEGGCGVTGFIASIPVRGRHIYEPSVQMHNRGNGKGGGIAAVGLSADSLGVTQQVLDSHYMLQLALLDPLARPEVERANIEPFLDVHKAQKIPSVDDYRDVEGLEVKPPDVWRYFARVKKDVLGRFIEEHGLQAMDPARAEDEFIFQNSYRINQKFYASLGEQQAFVLSHGRNMMILKLVGYAEKVVDYYLLDEFKAHGWIAHQRYPTKGRVWHPGGAHPFSGMDEALVHNGDFANYHAVCEYLKQHNIHPQFLTDTEVSVLLLDLLGRTFEYPMEYIIEAMAPTTEHDFDQLPPEKQHIYRYIQSSHIHASPDGPWFFIIARNNPYDKFFQLIGITDTSMLRPQVFALQEGAVQIGLVCSEKQAIDATLQSLADEDDRFCPVADKYWNARGGSATDGGSFMFTVKDAGKGDGSKELICTNKFGQVVRTPPGQQHFRPSEGVAVSEKSEEISRLLEKGMDDTEPADLKQSCREFLTAWDYVSLGQFCDELIIRAAKSDARRTRAIDLLTHLNDRLIPTGTKKRSAVLQMIRQSLATIFASSPKMNENGHSQYRYIDWSDRDTLRPPREGECICVLNAKDFPPEGDTCDARLICDAYEKGWKQFICYGYKGQRFTGCGLSTDTDDVRIDVYDSSGDYLASGIDGLEIHVHGNAQDQLGQIIKRGKLVIYGDVGQTFMYGAKGGDVYVMGNAAGRPLINAVGRPRVVINGTCLDYLAESFMAGDPLNGGGFVVLNGIEFDTEGKVIAQANPYPGSNLFSLASGGAIYLRDPHKQVVEEQLNGGEFVDLTPADWDLILPYLEENQNLFGISIENDLLQVDGEKRDYASVYRKVQAARLDVLAKASTAVEEWGEEWQE
ncbi:MAG: glutamate synthase [Desulfosarcina sp.]|nr:glutamate synthase [Desulfosarcina sp.]MBC2743540.1 glutamate synthase [Desulfosarcina sp.]MBC2766449.1 glutamate synthase [Desulfosarcina sp.]